MAAPMRTKYLPGDRKIDEIVRVDHSGELGAVKIYLGQILAVKHLARLGCSKPELLNSLEKMQAQEKVHYEYFKSKIALDKIRPSLFTPLWSGVGFAIGYFTGLLGQRTAMALTVAVEEVIGDHYAKQLKDIDALMKGNICPTLDLEDLKDKISLFRDEELEHLHTGVQSQANEMCGHFCFNTLVKAFTKAAISVAKNI